MQVPGKRTLKAKKNANENPEQQKGILYFEGFKEM